jgi:DNA invertase Pin-like site-specific DNA recombinase
MTSVYGYCRVSGIGQTKGHGPQRQREDITEFAAHNGYTIAGWYEDAHTGTESDRPQFIAMLGAMMENGVKTVIVESLDRFARDLLIQSTLLAKLASEGLTLIAANTGENVTNAMQDDPMRKAMVQIQGVFAELDKNLTVRKLRKAREAIRSTGARCDGIRPFGHYEGEAEVVRYIKELTRQHGYEAVASKLNAEGIPTRRGGKWKRQVVKDVALREKAT